MGFRAFEGLVSRYHGKLFSANNWTFWTPETGWRLEREAVRDFITGGA